MSLLRRRTPPPAVTFLTRQGCTLCVPAESVVRRVAAEVGAAYEIRDVDSDPVLRAAYTDKVPVVLLDGVEHSHWRVNEKALRRALRGS